MNYRKVTKKIRTIGNVAKITRAMQMVSAVKMKRAQRAAIEARPYREKLESVLDRLVTGPLSDKEIPYLTKYRSEKKLIILISSNKGLCGGFNTGLMRFLLLEKQLSNSDFITIGSKGASFARRLGKQIADFSVSQPIDEASAIFESAKNAYFQNKYQAVYLVFNQYLSSMSYKTASQPFLPVTGLEIMLDKEQSKDSVNYTFEPSGSKIILSVIEDLLIAKIRSAILDSSAAEHCARMMAMQAATDNASGLISSLTLYRNKLRQASITSELLEMTSAKESTEAVY